VTRRSDDKPDRPTKAARRAKRAERRRQRIVASTAVLPGLLTISNGLLGFAAIAVATRQESSFTVALSNQAIACWLIVAAMLCDMLDGRVARMTHRTSDFGGQLDSMCDVISFGVAPAMIMLRTALLSLHETIGLTGNRLVERTIWCTAAIYVACAVLRLARFNVENEPDEAAHMDFKGLPSPGAAGSLISLVILFEHLRKKSDGGWMANTLLRAEWFSGQWILVLVCVLLPIAALSAGLLMVSRFKYAHLINHYIRGKRPVSYLVKIIVLVLAVVIMPLITLTAATQAFVLSGPTKAVLARLHGRRSGPVEPPPQPSEDPDA